MDDEQLLDVINKAAFEVRKNLTAGYVESVYKNALLIELRLCGLVAEDEVLIPVYYKGVEVGKFRVDILVERRIILELKATSNLLPIHEAQLVNYLVATGFEKGVLINYGGDRFAFRIKTKDNPFAHTKLF